MPRVLVLCFLAILSATPAGAATGGKAGSLLAPFDPGEFAAAEARVLQASLAASGDYAGALDGRWTNAGAAALATWSAREFGGPPLNAHAAAAVAGFLDAADADGWREVELPDLGLAIALPVARLNDPVDEAGGTRRWSVDGTFTLLTNRFDRDEAAAWHDAASGLAAHTALESRGPDRLITTGDLADGRSFYTRSDLVAGAWSTVYLAADPSAKGALRLAVSSLHAGRPEPFAIPSDGRLAALLSETATLADASRRDPAHSVPAAEDPEETRFAATPARYDAAITALPPAGGLGATPTSGTGTGFFFAPGLILTAQHVVGECSAPVLADGTPLEMLAGDAELDVAVLRSPRPARRWLALADGRSRLGQRVYAVGFPYYSIAGTSLTLTSGNVSALAGIDDDRRFLSFTAPVQPGNSGGPLIDARGQVAGLVVARLSEDYIVEATGSLPQNVNYALREDELAEFLARNGIAGTKGALPRFDPDDGVPDDFESAIVPILCP